MMLPTIEELRTRFLLSPRQAEVALLLAQGYNNKAIAIALRRSPHTTRHLTEQVLFKLKVPTRAQVLPVLLGLKSRP